MRFFLILEDVNKLICIAIKDIKNFNMEYVDDIKTYLRYNW